jgi:hypothetical protein
MKINFALVIYKNVVSIERRKLYIYIYIFKEESLKEP